MPVTYLVTPVFAFWLDGSTLHAAPVKDDNTVDWDHPKVVETDDPLVQWVGTYLEHLTKVVKATVIDVRK